MIAAASLAASGSHRAGGGADVAVPASPRTANVTGANDVIDAGLVKTT
jgi:hypothetical protein